MANVMSMKSVRNNVSRNGFDLSLKKNFTAKCGELLPVMCKEVIPGDKVVIDLSSFTRTMPINTAAFARVKEYYDFFFVPFSHLWNRSNTVLSQMDFNQMHATGLNETFAAYNGELPYVTQSQIAEYIRNVSSLSDAQEKMNMFGFERASLSCKLLEYLGYGRYYDFLTNPTGGFEYNLDLNAFGLLAYQKIYADFYRDEQWEKPSPSTFNVDYMSGTGVASSMQMSIPTSKTDDFFKNYNLFDLRYCNWPKDLYHGILPNAQYGDTAVVPLGTGASGSFTLNNLSGYLSHASTGDEKLKSFSNRPPESENPSELSCPGAIWLRRNPAQGNNEFCIPEDGVVSNDDKVGFGMSYYYQKIGSGELTGFMDGSAGSSLSILALRQYEFLQKWKEIVQSTGQNYKDQIKAIWGVDVSDHLSDRCTYLGGISGNLSINEVVNTNITGDYDAQIAGKGVSIANGKIEYDSRGEFGYIMCIYHCLPQVDYTTSYVDLQYMRVNAEDFANPVFDRVGMQQVSVASILNRFGIANNFDGTPRLLGYVPRYADYKTSIDTSVGAFIDTMSHWVVSYDENAIFQGLTGSGGISQVGDEGQPNPNDPNTDISATYQYLKVNPHLLDPLFTEDADSSNNTDQFLCSAFFDIKAVRNLDVDGLPY